jgi:hypothetical protein
MRQIGDGEYEAVSYRVFHLGALNNLRAWGIELAFDIRETINAVRRIFAIAADEAAQRRFHPSPISLRFVKSAAAFLAPAYGRDTCMIEIGSLVGVRGSSTLFSRYSRELLGGEPPVRPHWGLDLDALRGNTLAQKLFPRWDAWERAYRTYNYKGTFSGRFTDRLGISI